MFGQHDDPAGYDGFSVFGSGSAAKFERLLNSKRIPVLSVDLALKSGSGFDWQQKIVFQLTPAETPEFLCCVLGILSTFKAQFHGGDRRKSLELVTQPARGSMYLKVWNKGQPIGIEIPAEKVFELSALALKILSEQVGFDSPTCLALLRGTAGRLFASKEKNGLERSG